MKVVVKTRAYDAEFYADMGYRDDEAPAEVIAQGRAVLWGEDEVEI